MSENNDFTVIDGPTIPEYVAENYRALIADPNRTLTAERIAEEADAAGDAALAAWARGEAAAAGEDVTPTGAAAAPLENRDYNTSTVEALKAELIERGVDVAELKLKADFVAAAELADESDQ